MNDILRYCGQNAKITSRYATGDDEALDETIFL